MYLVMKWTESIRRCREAGPDSLGADFRDSSHYQWRSSTIRLNCHGSRHFITGRFDAVHPNDARAPELLPSRAAARRAGVARGSHVAQAFRRTELGSDTETGV